MKYRWNPSLRPLALLAALAAFALPARADTLSCVYGGARTFNIATGTEPWFNVIRDDVSRSRSLFAESSDETVVQLKSSVVTLSKETSNSDGEDTATFYLVPIKAGTATITVEIDGDPDPNATISFTVNVSGEDMSMRISLSPDMVDIDEGVDTNNVYIVLGSAPAAVKTLELRVDGEGDPSEHLTLSRTTVDIPAGQTKGFFRITAIDGPYNFTVTVHDPDDEYQDGVLQGSIFNVAPVLLDPNTDPEAPNIVLALAGAPFPFTATASDDSSVDDASLVYHWTGSTNTTDTATITVHSEGEKIRVYATDKDGGRSLTGYYEVQLADSGKILFTDACTLPTIVAGGGNGAADFVINPNLAGDAAGKDDASQPWDEGNGNNFYYPGSTMVQPILAPGTYPFGWQFPDDQTTLASSPSDLVIPNPNTGPILVIVPEKAATIKYFSSNPYKDFWNELTGARIDDFGDFDQDGLSDTWEAWYLDGGQDLQTHSFLEWQTLAVTVAKGLYGSSGTIYAGGSFYNEQDTPDNDRIPTSRYEEIANGWADDPHLDTSDDAKNLVRAFLYPLSGDYVDYGTHVGEDVEFQASNGRIYGSLSSVRNPRSKPFFSNILEFRGLQQTSTEISADIKNAPNWVAWGYPGILSRTNLNVRGNCPGTDPMVADTDADGREDGWEYYFWSTILYENKPEYWRAYDPTLVLYPHLTPLGNADFKPTGIPLLRKEGIQEVLVTNSVNVVRLDGTPESVDFADWDDWQAANAGNYDPDTVSFAASNAPGSPVLYNGGLFVRYPDEEFEVEKIRSECYYGNPVLDPSTRDPGKKNYLTNAPIASTPYEDIDGTVRSAVEFTIGNLVVYTREGYVDDLGRAKLYYTAPADLDGKTDPTDGQPFFNARELSDFWNTNPIFPTKTEPGEIEGAYVDFRTGYFYLPGYDYFPPAIQALIGDRNAICTARYRTMNGIFPKAWLLNQFDPNDKLAPNIADPNFNAILAPLGLSRNGWDPVSDLDGDGLSDFEEYYLGTNPLNWDNDNDGIPDGWEVLFGLDPHDKNDAEGNPDCDRMFVSGYQDDRGEVHYYRHADAFLYDYFTEAYWNGQQSLGFVPGVASAGALVKDYDFTSREEFYMQKWMMGKAGRNLIFLSCVYPSQWLDGMGRCVLTTNPRNDDSNNDHIPDGWALYAGYIPVSGVDLIDHVWGPLHDFFPPICPPAKRPDPDGDGLQWRQEYENWAMVTARGSQITNEVYVAEEQDVFHEPDWYVPGAVRWTNKLRPTSPWIADTDGDGLTDSAEYMEEDYDWNYDKDTLVNLNPTTADTRFDRLPDSWHYMTGLYDTTNAIWGDTEDLLGPYGDPDHDGLPNYMEYLAGAVYAWRYDQWYSPDRKAIWQPDLGMSGYTGLKTPDAGPYLQQARARDPLIAENYSVNPIVIGGAEARRMDPDWDPEVGPWDANGNDPGLPFWEDAWPFGKSVHFEPYRPSDFFRAKSSTYDVNKVIRTVLILESRWTQSITHTPKVLETDANGVPVLDASGNPKVVDGPPHTAVGWGPQDSPTLNDFAKANNDPTFIVSPIANYIQRVWSLMNDRQRRYALDIDPLTGAELPTAFISIDEYYTIQDAIGILQDYFYSYGAKPAPWEPGWDSETIQVVDAGPPVLWRFMTPNYVGQAGFPTCMPLNPDSDGDGMDDYWEIYHGLNPLYGGSPEVGKAGGYPDSDRADRHPYGNGSTRDWIMAGNPAYVRVLTPTEIGLQPIKREDSAFHTPLTGMPIAEAAHFDYKTRPWLAGDRFADPDQDGLSNQEESYDFLLNDVLHHTDPSPYWFTDPSYAESYANLYYKLDGELAVTYWWWDQKLLGSDGDGPTYLFDFEMGEGYDTDNDNISDREELTQSDNSGVTDPLDLDSPRNRKALYFDGHAAARTRNPYYHDKFSLTSFTVEFWVRPGELPSPGKRMTLVQRPVLMPVDDSSGASHWAIRHNFLLQLDELGRICATVDNDGLETVSSATVISSGRLVPEKWTHVALVMDSVGDRLTLYINGEYAAGVGAGLKPCTGGLFGFQWLSPSGLEGTWENANLYDYSPAPIVLGAYDRNPWGVVAGPYETYPWGARRSSTLAGQNQPDFDPDQYFVGWIDEVRIWDRDRSQSEIKNCMMKRFTKEDIEEVNRKRLAWELEGWEPDRVGVNLVAATSASDFPQKLLYHYAFDNLPDTIGNDRDTSFSDYFGQDGSPYPAGWNDDVVSAYRPDPFWTAPWWYHYRTSQYVHLVPWWYTALHRSNVYSDYSYVPWIENTVAHMPQTPALDMKGLFPNWNADWTVASYRYRSPVDWLNDALISSDFVPYRRDDIVPAALPAAGSTDVQLSQIKNTMNPYVMFYRTAVSAADETAPNAFLGKLDTYGRYTGIPVLSDMLPLMDAVADIDVPMWDGKGRGTELSGVDTDGDGLPDWWEIVYGLDPNDASGENGAYGDIDDDGLDNWAEYLANTNPFRYDTDSDGYSDYYSRPDNQSLTYGELYDDGDGMDNVWEEKYGLDPNRYDATDDADSDGWTNWEEYMAGTNPTRSDKFPEPQFNATFHYTGNNGYGVYGTPAPVLVKTYGEKTAGRKMGGQYDGTYYSRQTELGQFVAERNTVEIGGTDIQFDWVANMANQDISSDAIVAIRVENQTVECQVVPSAADSRFGIVYQNEGTHDLVVMDYEMGVMYGQTGFYYTTDGTTSYNGAEVTYTFNGGSYEAEYAVSPKSFPFSLHGMTRVPEGNGHDHMVSGWNRFLGWLDLDGDGEWLPGEPMGLSQPRPALVSWDSVETTIPLVDSVWDYPRIAWLAPTNVPGIGEMTYFVDFTWVRGQSTGTEEETIGGGNASYSRTGDWDGDGLEDWMEVLAGAPAKTNSVPGVDPSDYYLVDPGTGFTYGELYDDGDGMPTAWEMKYGLDPYRYDAKGDVDDDGWSNYAEFMAGTDPTSAVDYPQPRFAATFYYHGEETDLVNLGVYTYGQKTQGATWGGSYDGRYTSTKGFLVNVVLGSDGTLTLDEYSNAGATGTFAVNKLEHGLVESSSIDVYVPGADGAIETRSFQMTQINPGMGLYTQDEMGAILISLESGKVLSTGDYVGKEANVSTMVKTYTFPVTFTDLVRNPEGNHTHMVEGPNRFLGWMDLDGNQTYDQGEPMGLGLYSPTLVDWDSAAIEVPLTDSLWDYPRVSWNDFAPSNFEPRVYIVTFTAEGKTSIGEGATQTVGIYGDLDGDGLDAWMESQADTTLNNMDSDGDGRMDYDSPNAANTATWGELLDDGDGMPASWEIAYGIEPYYDLDPQRFDADRDLDDDGWSNWAEFMANTDPSNPDSFPEPDLDVTFRYDGEVDGASKIKVFAYSEKTEGSNLAEDPKPDTIYMGGQRDGLYMTQSKSVGIWGDFSLKYEALDTDWGATFIGGKGIVSATLVWFGADGTEYKQDMQSFAANPDYGYFLNDGTARIFIEKSTGMILTQFYEEDLDASSIEGEDLGGGNGVGVQTARSSLYAPNYTVEYSVAGKDYPMTIPHLSRGDLLSKHNHMMEGYNRFLAFMDMNANDEWDDGEPMGISLYDATLVGYDSVVAEIPLTDGLFGFERIKWSADPTTWIDAAETNEWGTHYQIAIKDGNGARTIPVIVVETPRTFMHEGDYVEAAYVTQSGKRVLDPTKCGLKFSSTNDLFTYKVTAHDGASTKLVAQGSFRHVTGPAGGRRATAAIYPVAGNVVHDSLVEFQWKMDSRTQGVIFNVKRGDTAVISDLYVPFPVRHNKVNDDDYYYSYIPQLKDGRTLVEFANGSYTYTITPVLNASAIPASDKSLKAISGSFEVQRGSDDSRDHASISGNVHYYGRMADASGAFATGNLVVQAYKLPDDASTAVQISGNPIAKKTLSKAGPFTLEGFAPGKYALIAFVDANKNGRADVGETQGLGFLGLDRPSGAKGGGSAIPVQLPEWFSPIEIRVGRDSSSAGAATFGAAIDVEDVHIVLRDRDTNGDGIPELAKAAGDTTKAAYLSRALRTFPASKNFAATKTYFSTNWPTLYWFDKNFHPVSSRSTPGSSSYAEGSSVQFAVPAPRTFLHEGDLARTGLYGFNLGENNALNITWNVIATDGYHSQTNEGGSFSVYAGLPLGTEGDPDPRHEMKPRWPTQNTVVHGSVVEFEWEMDFRTAGVDFRLEGVTDPTFATNITVPFPVMHWDPSVQCYYYKARPQMEDGLRFLSLPDGTYRYTITERTNTDTIPPQSITETFRIRNAENTITTGSIEGDVWYYGRSTVPGSNPPRWGKSLHVQAYKVSDVATSSASVGGQLVAETVRNVNGGFRLEGLKEGTYSVFAFVDSNGNGIADDWETQGFGFYGGNASPVVIPSAAVPIVVTNGASVVGVNVVLHDRDTDGDMLPDVWEWETNGDLSGSDPAGYTGRPQPDVSILTNWSWKIDSSTVVTRTVDIPETDGIRVRVDGPRTFLHEGDFITPWVYVNEKKNLVAEGVPEKTDNRDYYMWHRNEDGGWDPMQTPYYGFELGSYSNVVVKWSVSVWDGAASMQLDNGAFRVVARVGTNRKPLLARYPTQSREVHGNVVEFEWEMDESNAGVLFNLWKIDGDDGLDYPVQVITNMVVAFPVQHGKSGTDGCYWSAFPQLEDGLQTGAAWTPNIGKTFIALPGDGLYEYSITERPRTAILAPEEARTIAQVVTERFRLSNSGETRGLYDVSGSIRYYGRVMESVPVDGVAFAPNATRTVWTASAPTNEIVRGAMSVLVMDGADAVEMFSDSQANGVLYASGGTNATAWSGTIDYETGAIEVRFSRGLAAGRTVSLARKAFPAPLFLQAFRLSDEATTCVSVSGSPVYQEVRRTKGDFKVPNLVGGKYAIRAFLDSNGNGYADEWETQGFAVMTGTVSPNVDPKADPIVVRDNVAGLMIVLHDRDMDNDLLPDSWEWWKADGTLLTSGYDVDEGGLEWWRQYADGVLDSDPRTPDTDLDGLTDAMEILVTQTDTHLKDTDGDGLGDLEEFLSGSDPNSANSAVPYTIPALSFDANGVPFVEVSYPALRPGVTLTYELQRKLSLAPDEAWETVAELPVANDGGAVYYSQYDGVNAHLSEPGTATMWPQDQAEGVDFSTGFFRIKVYADYGKMVENDDGTCSFMTWVRTGTNTFEYKEAARGKGTLVRDSNGNWSFVSSATGLKGALVRDDDGNWSFQE